MRSILKSRWVMGSAAAAIATLGLFATTTAAEAAYCAQWRYGHCVDWRYNSYNYNYNNNGAAALNAFAGVMGAAVAASQPRYYYPPAPAYGYYAPAPAYGYYAPPPAYYGPEPGYYGWR